MKKAPTFSTVTVRDETGQVEFKGATYPVNLAAGDSYKLDLNLDVPTENPVFSDIEVIIRFVK